MIGRAVKRCGTFEAGTEATRPEELGGLDMEAERAERREELVMGESWASEGGAWYCRLAATMVYWALEFNVALDFRAEG